MDVNDRSLKATGGLQHMKSIDGYVFPIDIINGLPYTPMRASTDSEWNDLPHIIWTSDDNWDPSILDSKISDKDNWYQGITDLEEGLTNSPFDMVGRYKQQELEIPIAEMTDINAQDKYTSDDIFDFMFDRNQFDYASEDEDEPSDFESPKMKLHVNRTELNLSMRKYEELRPCFLGVNKEVIEKTLDATTQYGKQILSGPTIWGKMKSPNPAMNVPR
jgi:hypothetical protein